MMNRLFVYGSARNYALGLCDRAPNDIDVMGDKAYINDDDKRKIYQWARGAKLPSGLPIDYHEAPCNENGYFFANPTYDEKFVGANIRICGYGESGSMLLDNLSSKIRAGDLSGFWTRDVERLSPPLLLSRTYDGIRLDQPDSPLSLVGALNARLRWASQGIAMPYHDVFGLIQKWKKEPSWWPSGMPDSLCLHTDGIYFYKKEGRRIKEYSCSYLDIVSEKLKSSLKVDVDENIPF